MMSEGDDTEAVAWGMVGVFDMLRRLRGVLRAERDRFFTGSEVEIVGNSGGCDKYSSIEYHNTSVGK